MAVKPPSDRILKSCAGAYVARRLCWAYAHIDYIISVDVEKKTFITDVTGFLFDGKPIDITAEFGYTESANGKIYITAFCLIEEHEGGENYGHAEN